MNEIWKDIEGYEGFYQISNLGNVKSLKRTVIFGNKKRATCDRILNPCPHVKGYLQINLRGVGKLRRFLIHRLVACAFIENPFNLPQINHKDENKGNNNVDNLEWCTAKYNSNYGTGIERCTNPRRKMVIQELNGIEINRFNSINDASRLLGYASSNISRCCNGKLKTVHGFGWKFVEEVKNDS